MKQLSVGRKVGTTLWLLSALPHQMSKTKLKPQFPSYCSHCGVTKLTSPKTDHLERTSNNFRQEMLSAATVLEILDASPSVKRLALHVHKPHFNFKAGQWVDLFIPGVSKVGGFSLCSSPERLAEESLVELAVKYSSHPPAHWVHRQDAPGCSPQKVSLVYTAKDSTEILFQESLLALMKEFPEQVRCHFHVTRQQAPVPDDLRPHLTVGKLTKNDLSARVNGTPRCYICGPPPMIEFVSETLQSLELPRAGIFYEKWW
uniref:Oxidoreductase NAD-binding domain-containing protein 1 n=1 Tax=Petromyzon marinus TaxID=7757 RepID=A0AAJ7WQY1_PETMA|nr:oxidoreductase NAD-binding domain-containing protein 1-like isoform X3 [Petromyzon marinus]